MQTKEFYLHPDKKFDDKILNHPVDSFKTDSHHENVLPPGNYVKVCAVKNELKYSLVENHSAFIHTFSNQYDYRFVLTDKLGGIIDGATVFGNNKPLQIDPKDKTYHLKRFNHSTIVQTDYAGVSNFYVIKELGFDSNDNDGHKHFSYKIKTFFNKLFKKQDNSVYRRYSSLYSGFITFNKPMYKPNDTVKFKAFILDKTKLPIKQNQLLVEVGYYGLPDKVLGNVKSYRDGGFEFSFAMNDSLKLELDRIYTIKLVAPEITKKRNVNKSGLYDEARHQILWTGNFRYEDYELKSINFSIRVDKEQHYPGEKQAVYLKATDENGLPVADGRVHLTITPWTITNYKSDHCFIADTIWAHEQTLDPIGETKITLPDSIFPKASISYNISASFLDASNQNRTANAESKFIYEKRHIQTHVNGDTLKADFFENAKNIPKQAALTAYNSNGDTLSSVKVMLPLKTTINQYVDHYDIEADSVSDEYELVQKINDGDIKLSADRTADSLFFKVDNPHNLQFWYAIYSGNKLVDEGLTKNIFYRSAHNQNNISSILVNYVWGGKSMFKYANTAYRTDQLKITVLQPTTVYPGQKVKTDIMVTDVAGKPVQNVDVTAWAVTSKFSNYYPSNVPYTGKQYQSFLKPKKVLETADEKVGDGVITLNWNRWSRQMGLDSITYYRFTHTPAIYQQEETVADTITQIAPFVVKNGDIIPVHILYIDERPVFFSQAQQLQRYSFRISPGKHSLRFRTSHKDIKLDSVNIVASHKLILGLNADYIPSKNVSDTLSDYEAGLINQYMITVVNNFDDQQAFVEQNNSLFLLPNTYARNNEAY